MTTNIIVVAHTHVWQQQAVLLCRKGLLNPPTSEVFGRYLHQVLVGKTEIRGRIGLIGVLTTVQDILNTNPSLQPSVECVYYFHPLPVWGQVRPIADAGKAPRKGKKSPSFSVYIIGNHDTPQESPQELRASQTALLELSVDPFSLHSTVKRFFVIQNTWTF